MIIEFRVAFDLPAWSVVTSGFVMTGDARPQFFELHFARGAGAARAKR